jgi:NAD(P)-dependent dehydrogenase (short-subunit alcohol dehydrogenase family)
MMREQGWGRIINMSGTDGFSGAPNRPANVSAKAAMHGFSKALAKELGRSGITCNTIGVGMINTERDWSQYSKADMDYFIEHQVALGHMGEPEDIAEACLFLAGESGRYITGQVIHVNGGLYMA